MPNMINDKWIRVSVMSAIFSSLVGSLLVLTYLSWGKNITPVVGLIFNYFFIVMVSIIGTTMGSMIIGMPLAMISKRFFPDAALKGCFFIVCSALFMWLVILAWPVIRICETPYSDILLLSPMLSVQLPHLLIWSTGIDEYYINQDRGRRTVNEKS